LSCLQAKVSVVVSGAFNYDQEAGCAANNYSFIGTDSEPVVRITASKAPTKRSKA
jgi:hypothetical protein